MEEETVSVVKPDLAQEASLSGYQKTQPEAQDSPVNPKKSKSKLLWIILGAAILILLAVAAFFLLSNRKTISINPKVYRVGILTLSSFSSSVGPFKAKMSELGYIENKNIIYELQVQTTDAKAMQANLDKFAEEHVDLVFVLGTPPTFMAKKIIAEKGIPLVFSFCNVEGNNLIKSLQRPEGNLTGVRFPGADVTVKRLEFLMEIAPKAKRIWTAYDKTNPSALGAIAALRPAAKLSGITLVEVPLNDATGINADLQAREALADIGIDAILIMPEGLTQSAPGWNTIRDFAAKHKIPIGGGVAFEADDGAVFSYVPDNSEVGQLSAVLVDKILRGTLAGDIPIVTPESRLRINYKIAQELGITVSEDLLTQAEEIIR